MNPNVILLYIGAFLFAVAVLRLILKGLVKLVGTVIGGAFGLVVAVVIFPVMLTKALLFPAKTHGHTLRARRGAELTRR